MTMYPYQDVRAFNEYTRTIAGPGHVYALSDADFSTPLRTVDDYGLPVKLTPDPDTGDLPYFWVDGHTEVRFKSGEWFKVFVTTMALPGVPGEPGNVQPALEAAEKAATTAQAALDVAQEAKTAAEDAANNARTATQLADNTQKQLGEIADAVAALTQQANEPRPEAPAPPDHSAELDELRQAIRQLQALHGLTPAQSL